MASLHYILSQITFVIQKLRLDVINARLFIYNPPWFTIIGPTIIIANEGGYLKEKGYYVKGHFSRACLRVFYLIINLKWIIPIKQYYTTLVLNVYKQKPALHMLLTYIGSAHTRGWSVFIYKLVGILTLLNLLILILL